MVGGPRLRAGEVGATEGLFRAAAAALRRELRPARKSLGENKPDKSNKLG